MNIKVENVVEALQHRNEFKNSELLEEISRVLEYPNTKSILLHKIMSGLNVIPILEHKYKNYYHIYDNKTFLTSEIEDLYTQKYSHFSYKTMSYRFPQKTSYEGCILKYTYNKKDRMFLRVDFIVDEQCLLLT